MLTSQSRIVYLNKQKLKKKIKKSSNSKDSVPFKLKVYSTMNSILEKKIT